MKKYISKWMKKGKNTISLLLLSLLISFQYSISQPTNPWFHGESIASTVLLEKELSGHFVAHGTGFIILPYKSSNQLIITCEHVLRNKSIFVNLEVNERFRNFVRTLPSKQKQEIIDLLKRELNLLWNVNENFLRIKVDLIKDSTLFIHPKGLDIGGFKINLPGEYSFGDSTFKIINARAIGKSRIKLKEKTSLGDDVYFIGFPFGIGSPTTTPSQLNYSTSSPRHLLRKGTISWISHDYDEFLLDAVSYNGNSGSPLFQISYEADKPPFYLIGIIIGHLGQDQINFGLARCLSANEIFKVIELADR